MIAKKRPFRLQMMTAVRMLVCVLCLLDLRFVVHADLVGKGGNKVVNRFGGLAIGLFLLGMRHLSDGLQSASGERIRRIIGFSKTNRPAGVVTGIVSAIVVQS